MGKESLHLQSERQTVLGQQRLCLAQIQMQVTLVQSSEHTANKLVF